ncbi:NUDIX domain-containing protein [Flavimaricola marinus]|uniref:ADP-ribose pyrophosphatase n=1 Tax=Flavimaricola marinus TaxID=1819565 RepID=A0A238LIY8_9RHOB|nr:NUDIX domain-containing protein [Flavimaricola marinus]SMY09588.1 ADP-ribose pyrophosphatase [Flavimaricola marinus]
MHLFVYGTLCHRPLFDVVAGPADGLSPTVQPARLAGHAVDQVAGSALPMIIERHDAVAQGNLWSGLSAAQRARLDLYEVAFGYDLRVVTVLSASGEQVQAEAYFPPEDHRPAGKVWSLAEWERSQARAAILTAQEMDNHAPPLTGPELFRQWKMMQGRAEAKVRAGQGAAAASLRYDAYPQDFDVSLRAPLSGDFFKLAQVTIQHRTFAGQNSGPLPREVLVGCDAALVLPYDTVRDRVLLVEQFRTGPAVRHDSNPWSLEPVAGIVDPGESPEEAALRETGEEAGLSLTGLEKMFSIYPSPGSSTDHFHCFAGFADLDSLETGFGGLEHEAEDLRLHVLSLDDALALLDTGEINAGPLVAMLLWLARKRASGWQ